MRTAVHRDVILLHDLEERRVRLGRGAVDLVGQEELCKDRTRPEAELLLLHVEDGRASDVGRHQVGGELNPSETAAHDLAERPHEEGLPQTGETLDEYVSAGKEGH